METNMTIISSQPNAFSKAAAELRKEQKLDYSTAPLWKDIVAEVLKNEKKLAVN
jgi:hypothetical protein